MGIMYILNLIVKAYYRENKPLFVTITSGLLGIHICEALFPPVVHTPLREVVLLYL